MTKGQTFGNQISKEEAATTGLVRLGSSPSVGLMCTWMTAWAKEEQGPWAPLPTGSVNRRKFGLPSPTPSVFLLVPVRGQFPNCRSEGGRKEWIDYSWALR